MKRLLFGLGFAVMVLVAAELLLRLVLPGPDGPDGHIAPALVNHGQWFSEVAGTVTASYQEVLLTPEVFRADEPRRIAFLGGSSVHGGTGKVPFDKEFPSLVEEDLGRPVLNLGLPGLDSHDHVRILEALLAYEVETVVLYCCHNDFGNLYFRDRFGGLAPSLFARLKQEAERLRLVAAMGKLVYRLKLPDPEPATKPGVAPEAISAAVERLEERLHKAADLAEHAGVQLVLVTPASALALPPAGKSCAEQPCARDLWQAGLDLTGEDPERGGELLRQARDRDGIPIRAPGAAVEVVRRVAAERDLLLVDAERDLPRATGLDVAQTALFEDLVHLTAQGHGELARLLRVALRE